MDITTDDQLHFACTWNPERWPQASWSADLGAMADAGLSCVRIGHGWWPRLQSQEDQWDWALLDAALQACEDHELGVILQVPTEHVPTWLPADADVPALCKNLVQALVDRYASRPVIRAWQLAGGMQGRRGAWQEAAFGAWLQQHYGHADGVNAAWGILGDADAVHDLATVTAHGVGAQHRLADWGTCEAASLRGMLEQELAVIRQAVPDRAVLVTGIADNTLGDLLAEFDAIGCVHEPSRVTDVQARPAAGRHFGRVRALARGLAATGQQAGQLITAEGGRLPIATPGGLAVAAIQSIAHGCNTLSWTPWRSAATGAAINVHGIVPAWGHPGRLYHELKDLIGQLRPHAADIARTKPLVYVARLVGAEQRLFHQAESWVHGAIGEPEDGRATLCEMGLNEDQIRPSELQRDNDYAVALLPYACGLTDADIAACEAWVRQGGVLIVGPMAGYRDASLRVPDQVPPPGALASLTGTCNKECTTWNEALIVHGEGGGGQFPAGRYAEIIEPLEQRTAVIARHDSGWLAGRPAITRRNLGDGAVIHVGVGLSDAVLRWLWFDQHLPRPEPVIITHDPFAEVLVRRNGHYALHFAINHGYAPTVCHLYRQVVDLLDGETLTNSFSVPPKGWRILKQEL